MSPNEAVRRRHYYPAIDGLRGLAILLVVAYHNYGFLGYTNFGWLGVDLFFVLSGFLITNIILVEKEDPNFLKKFYIRRVLRIFPLYYLFLIIFLWILPSLGIAKNELKYYTSNQAWLWTYLQNWKFSFDLAPDAKLMTHLWSLGVEEQFYLLWPLTIILVKSKRALIAIMLSLVAGLIFTRFILWSNHYENFNYTTLYTFTRFDGIFLGSTLALLYNYRPGLITKLFTFIVLGLAAINFIFYFSNNSDYPYFAFVGYTTFCTLFVLLLNEILNNNHIINRIFNNRVLIFFGKVSYGFYLFHWPIFVFSQPYVSKWLKGFSLEGRPLQLLTATLATLLGLLISILTYFTIERYFLGLMKNFRPKEPDQYNENNNDNKDSHHNSSLL
jgi:peptidoglycan/LPS O-acetylase OafA/YrhL